ncbi:hypothetical protein B296_00040740 [Ensete ventricosum]|uniref:Late embryogenesis abundant protein LEA-2 subgroup domain-containing protein n=1 Tax=Ensete ventricosum TaxID=4639 RepID=A0A426XKE4_ENSVE|nr:hypothetical protein B296_00040740 [Ensete ventricosum]
MMHNKSDSDVTSLAASSPPRSPKRAVYYVQSPSRDSHDGDKSSSMQATPVYNSPMESPSHPSFGRHSRTSSASRFSGPFRSSSGRKGNRKRVNDKGWPECNVIQEEGSYDDLDEDRGLSRRCQIILALLSFVLLFTVFSLIIWGAARPYKAKVVVKLKKYYQPRKSRRTLSLVLHGEKVPLYGAGAGLALSSTGGAVPLTLDLEIISRGYVIGKLVKVKHRKHNNLLEFQSSFRHAHVQGRVLRVTLLRLSLVIASATLIDDADDDLHGLQSYCPMTVKDDGITRNKPLSATYRYLTSQSRE